VADLPELDVRRWGPQLRFAAPHKLIETFAREVGPHLPPFLLFGSGDFHHLSALWIRHLREPVVVVSFDNHPDWDVRPPRWSCGGWINRALELPHVEKVSIWGCGNFECWWPAQLFGNRRAERQGRLDVHAWGDDQPRRRQERRGAIFYASWRGEFERFVAELGTRNVYVTIDMDCLRDEESITNWENGKFTADDVVWALQKLRTGARAVAGDVCGAYSRPSYARRTQAFMAEWDHPKLGARELSEARRFNGAALAKLWPALCQ
jgi:arginase family enzyme